MRVAYFTAGSVGAGHLTRGLAIQRAFARRGIAVDYRIFSAPIPFAASHRPEVTAVAIPADEVTDEGRARQSDLARALQAFSPELLLVDLFWAPVQHLIPLLRCEAWLLLRAHPRNWLVGPRALPFDRARYTRVFAIEPHVFVDGAERLEPIVVANRDEVRPRAELRRIVEVDDDAHLTLVVHAGKPGERTQLEQRARMLDVGAPTLVRVADLYDEKALFPIATFLDGADRVVGGAGYNLFWETRSLGLGDRTELQAFPRDLDDQTARIAACIEYAPRENGADALVRCVVGPAGFEPAA